MIFLLLHSGYPDRGSVPDQEAGDKVAVIQFVPVIAAAVFMIACGVDCIAVIDFVFRIVLLARGSSDNCDIPQKTVNSRVFEV